MSYFGRRQTASTEQDAAVEEAKANSAAVTAVVKALVARPDVGGSDQHRPRPRAGALRLGLRVVLADRPRRPGAALRAGVGRRRHRSSARSPWPPPSRRASASPDGPGERVTWSSSPTSAGWRTACGHRSRSGWACAAASASRSWRTARSRARWTSSPPRPSIRRPTGWTPSAPSGSWSPRRSSGCVTAETAGRGGPGHGRRQPGAPPGLRREQPRDRHGDRAGHDPRGLRLGLRLLLGRRHRGTGRCGSSRSRAAPARSSATSPSRRRSRRASASPAARGGPGTWSSSRTSPR